MRKFTMLCSAFALFSCALKAQTVATFDTLTLPGTDTFYRSYAHPGVDVGFNDGHAHFPCVYDTAYGGTWVTGFAYSNKSDTVTGSYTNEYSAKIGTGYGGTGKYVVAWCNNPTTYQYNMVLPLTGVAMGQPVEGFYITNTTYAYNSMRSGGYPAKKFGDTTGTGLTTGLGTAPDWFKLTVKGYHSGALQPDSVDFYLADFRPAGTANDSIIKGWHWVNLMPLGHVDSLRFSLSSSDNGSFGMNTPAYFCIDNFTTHESSLGLPTLASAIKMYPNPAKETLNIDFEGSSIQHVAVSDVVGNVLFGQATTGGHTQLNTAPLAPGIYFLKLTGNGDAATVKFIKE